MTKSSTTKVGILDTNIQRTGFLLRSSFVVQTADRYAASLTPVGTDLRTEWYFELESRTSILSLLFDDFITNWRTENKDLCLSPRWNAALESARDHYLTSLMPFVFCLQAAHNEYQTVSWAPGFLRSMEHALTRWLRDARHILG